MAKRKRGIAPKPGKTATRKTKRGPNKGDTRVIKGTTRGPRQQGSPFFPTGRVTRDVGPPSTVKRKKKKRR